METRIAKLEVAADDTGERFANIKTANDETRDRLIKVETRLDTFATKADLYRELRVVAWKILGSCSLLVAAVYFIARHCV